MRCFRKKTSISRKYIDLIKWQSREEKSLRHVATVAKISGWQQTEVNSHCFNLQRSYSMSFNLSNVEEISGLNPKGRYLSLQKAKDNFCVVFTYSIKRARKIRRFHVPVVQRRLRNLQKSVMHVQRCCFANLNLSPFCLSLCLSSVLLS